MTLTELLIVVKNGHLLPQLSQEWPLATLTILHAALPAETVPALAL